MMNTKAGTIAQRSALIFALSAGAVSLVAQAPVPAAAPAAGSAQKGKQLFESVGCYQCHGRHGEGGAAGPRLAPKPIAFQLFSKYPRQPAGQMPPYTAKVLPDADLADIYAYLQSLPPAPPLDSIPLLK
jgi:mono/diheme cytochrome c family protein